MDEETEENKYISQIETKLMESRNQIFQLYATGDVDAVHPLVKAHIDLADAAVYIYKSKVIDLCEQIKRERARSEVEIKHGKEQAFIEVEKLRVALRHQEQHIEDLRTTNNKLLEELNKVMESKRSELVKEIRVPRIEIPDRYPDHYDKKEEPKEIEKEDESEEYHPKKEREVPPMFRINRDETPKIEPELTFGKQTGEEIHDFEAEPDTEVDSEKIKMRDLKINPEIKEAMLRYIKSNPATKSLIHIKFKKKVKLYMTKKLGRRPVSGEVIGYVSAHIKSLIKDHSVEFKNSLLRVEKR